MNGGNLLVEITAEKMVISNITPMKSEMENVYILTYENRASKIGRLKRKPEDDQLWVKEVAAEPGMVVLHKSKWEGKDNVVVKKSSVQILNIVDKNQTRGCMGTKLKDKFKGDNVTEGEHECSWVAKALYRIVGLTGSHTTVGLSPTSGC